MRSKKKGQSKSHHSRHNKVEAPRKDAEVSRKEIETPGREAELSSKEAETPGEKAELSSKEAVTPFREAELPSKEAILSSKEGEFSSKEAILPSKEAELSSTEAELSNKETELPNKESELSSKEAESSSKEVNTPSVEVPSENHEHTTMPSILKVSTPVKDNAPLENFEAIKHPLEHTWGFWLFTNENKKNWTENQKKLIDFDTVEDYWCLYHYMKRPSELKSGQDYAIFKKGISPMWEDAANKVGGRWLMTPERKGELDRIWLDVVLLMIGENFENSDEICGAVVNVRSKSRVSVWTRSKEESSNMGIGRKLKQVLRIHFKLQFLDHKNNSNLYIA